jgi:hypothetical protein
MANVQANVQGKEGGNLKGFKCPKCKCFLVKEEGNCDCAYICINPECRGMSLEFPKYYGYTQEDIDSNIARTS